jgi:hypothetical protein
MLREFDRPPLNWSEAARKLLDSIERRHILSFLGLPRNNGARSAKRGWIACSRYLQTLAVGTPVPCSASVPSLAVGEFLAPQNKALKAPTLFNLPNPPGVSAYRNDLEEYFATIAHCEKFSSSSSPARQQSKILIFSVFR